MAEKSKFIAVLRASFPALTYTTATKCWEDIRSLPATQLDLLYTALLHASIVSGESRRALKISISNATGGEPR